MSKKILSVMLAIMLVLSTFAVTAFAAGSTFEVEDETEGVILSTQVWSLSEEATKVSDGVYTVDVALKTDYVTGAISFRVDAADGATLTDVEINEEVITYAYDLAFNANGLVAIVPQPATEAEEGIKVDGVIATLTYTLAGDGDTLTLVNDAKTETNPGGDLIAVRLDDNNLSTGTMVYGQRVVDKNGNDIKANAVIATVTLGEAAVAPADLAKKAAAEAGILIDTAHTFGGTYKGVVYGFTQKANNTFMNTGYITTNLEATNGGSLAFSRSIGATGYGTGTVITVKNADGSEAAKYVVVIFGDADCNGLINTADTTAVKNAVSVASNAPANSVKRMACNVHVINNPTLLHTLNVTDTTSMKNHVTGKAKFNPATLATYQNNNNSFYK